MKHSWCLIIFCFVLFVATMNFIIGTVTSNTQNLLEGIYFLILSLVIMKVLDK